MRNVVCYRMAARLVAKTPFLNMTLNMSWHVWPNTISCNELGRYHYLRQPGTTTSGFAMSITTIKGDVAFQARSLVRT